MQTKKEFRILGKEIAVGAYRVPDGLVITSSRMRCQLYARHFWRNVQKIGVLYCSIYGLDLDG